MDRRILAWLAGAVLIIIVLSFDVYVPGRAAVFPIEMWLNRKLDLVLTAFFSVIVAAGTSLIRR